MTDWLAGSNNNLGLRKSGMGAKVRMRAYFILIGQGTKFIRMRIPGNWRIELDPSTFFCKTYGDKSLGVVTFPTLVHSPS